MRFRYLYPIFRLIFVGVLLGLSARLFFGKPATLEDQDRRFTQPLGDYVMEVEEEVSDFPLVPIPNN
jgi:hypothetical protein